MSLGRLKLPYAVRTGTNFIAPLKMYFSRSKSTLDSLKSVKGGNRHWMHLDSHGTINPYLRLIELVNTWLNTALFLRLSLITLTLNISCYVLRLVDTCECYVGCVVRFLSASDVINSRSL